MFILDCNETVQMCYNARKILVIVKTIIKVIQWSVPLLLVFLGTWDMFKAVTKADDQKAVQDSTKKFIRRLISGVIVFLVPFLVRLIFDLVEDNIISDGDISGTSWVSCWNNVDKKNSNYFSGCNNIYSRTSSDNEESNNEINGDSESVNGKKTCYVFDLYATCSIGSLTKKGDNYYGGSSCRLDVKNSDIHVNNSSFSDTYAMYACDSECKKYSSTTVVAKIPKKEGVCTCIWSTSSKTNVGLASIPSSSADGTYKIYSCNSDISCTDAASFCTNTGKTGTTKVQ